MSDVIWIQTSAADLCPEAVREHDRRRFYVQGVPAVLMSDVAEEGTVVAVQHAAAAHYPLVAPALRETLETLEWVISSAPAK